VQGRAFAWQEALMIMALLIQRFDLTMDDPSYTLQIKTTLTVKPANFKIRARPRPDREHIPPVPSNFAVSSGRKANIVDKSLETMVPSAPHIYIYYGSNSGSAETFAQRIASDAPSKGKM
jgi:cytochrome P450/NADPH-cytochrome P450 reductase